MKKYFSLILCLFLLCSFVSAKHYFIGDDSRAIDAAINKVKSSGHLDSWEIKNNADVTIKDLDNKVTTVLYKNKAVIILGENSPASHAILGGEIGKYLKSENGYDVLPAMTSDEVVNNDLYVIFGDPVICKDSDGLDYDLKGSTTGIDDTGNFVTVRDSCNGNVLVEQYCDEGIVRSDFHDCDSCDDGRCVKVEQKEIIEKELPKDKPTPVLISEEPDFQKPVVKEIEPEVIKEEIKKEEDKPGVVTRLFSWFKGLFGF